MQKIESSEQKMETNGVIKVKLTNRYQKMMTKRLNNPNHYTICDYPVTKIELCAQLKNKNKANTSVDIIRLLESHIRRKGNRFSTCWVVCFRFAFSLEFLTKVDESMHLNTYSRFRFNVLLITWQHSEVEHNFKSTVVITLHLNNKNTLFDVYS